MVGKTYLRYIVGPQGGAVVSNEALTVAAALGHPTYGRENNQGGRVVTRFGRGSGGRGGGRGGFHATAPARPPALSTLLFLPSLEAVRVYSVKSGMLLHTLIPAELKMPVEVTAVQLVPLHDPGTQTAHHTNAVTHVTGNTSGVLRNGWMLLVGYSNGHVAVFSCTATNNYGKPVCLFYALGHKIDTKVLTLAADPHPSSKTVLCSAGQDTDVTVWDLVSMEAAFRLRGHRGGVTGMAFVPAVSNSTPSSRAALGSSVMGTHTGAGVQVLVTAAADGWIKVWDLHLRQCLQTLVACDTQVTAMFMDATGSRLYCGMRENVIKVYNTEALTRIVSGGEGSQATGTANPMGSSVTDALEQAIVPHGQIARRHYKPITFMSASADGVFLLACTSNTIEVFRMNTAEEVKKKMQRKKKRKQRSTANQPAGDEGEEHDNDNDNGENVDEKGRKRSRMEDGSAHPASTGEEDQNEGEEEADNHHHTAMKSSGPVVVERSAAEEVTLIRTFFLTEKVRSACFLPSTTPSMGGAEGEELHIAVTYRNNDVQTYTTTVATSDVEGAATYRLTDLKSKFSLGSQGHQSDVRQLCFVDNDCALVSLSREKLMLWTVSIRQDRLESEDGTGIYASTADANHDFYDEKEANVKRTESTGTLVPVGQLALEDATAMDAMHSALCCVGQANGSLLLVDIAASSVLFTEPAAHMGGVKHVTKTADKNGFMTVGEDRRLLSWTIGLSTVEDTSNREDEAGDEEKQKASRVKPAQQPTLLLAHEVELTELPLFVECSLDQRFIGIGLQNHHIQLFFADTLKPYLSLFGHKLPPTAMSFSTDGTLVASVGMDKSLRFWGTDFGDCHRAIHAHDEYITAVQFLRETHYVFTVSMDGSVKQWDGDRFLMIQMFRQHPRGLWSLAVTVNGTCVVAAGADKSLRCFLRTAGIVFPQEEEERMAHEAMEEEAAKNAARARLDGVTESGDGEVAVAGHASATTAEAAEKLMSALDLVSVERQRQENPEDLSPRHPLLANKSEWEYLWSVMQSIRATDIRHALNGLTSLHVDALLDNMVHMIDAGAVLNFEIAAKFLLGLVMPAPGVGSSGNSALRSIAIAGDAGGTGDLRGAQRLENLRRRIAAGLDHSVSRLDYNTAGLQAVRHALEESEKIKFFDLSKIQGYKKKYHSRAIL